VFSAGRTNRSEQGKAEVAGSGSREDLPFGMLSRSTEFGSNRAVRPQVTVVLGADKDVVTFDERELKLTKWNRHAFAQGVVMFAFDDLMPVEQRLMLAKRAVIWADSAVDMEQLRK
jgi:hypothetical protein